MIKKLSIHCSQKKNQYSTPKFTSRYIILHSDYNNKPIQQTHSPKLVNSLPTKESLSSKLPCKRTVFAEERSSNSFCQCLIVDKGTMTMQGPVCLNLKRNVSMHPTACIVLPG